MDELIAFLRARCDEAEAIAKAAYGDSGQWWQRITERGPEGHLFEGSDPEGGYLSGTIVVYDEGSPTPDEFAHIALHDPAAVLRDITAKRKRLATYTAARAAADRYDDQYMAGVASGLGDVIKDDAAVWSDHPDYQPAWSL